MPASKGSAKKTIRPKQTRARQHVYAGTSGRDAPTGDPLIFISHDSRDHELAEEFSTLLRNISMGLLKSFRSSDSKGTQGIEFGSEWFPTIKEKLLAASDVVCLLTQNSLDRPWILYEAGVAFGKLDTPVLGVALGIPLKRANTGPFAQFQNCDDGVDSLTKLVLQLARRVPNAEPAREQIIPHVSEFKQRIEGVLTGRVADEDQMENDEVPGVPALFEEVKVMFKGISNNLMQLRRSGALTRREALARLSLERLDVFLSRASELETSAALFVYLSLFRETYPWVYELTLECLRDARSNRRVLIDRHLRQLDLLIQITLEVEGRYTVESRQTRLQSLLKNFTNLVAAVAYERHSK